MPQSPDPAERLFKSHERGYRDNRYVYPVVSRRSGGLSIGVNLNPDKACNFNCIYCQVDRAVPGPGPAVDVGRVVEELQAMLDLVACGGLFGEAKYRATPERLRELKDLALSGDGEPTSCANFEAVVAACADVHRRRRLDHVKMVLITNASLLEQPQVQRALRVLDAANGEIWAKLDAGTEPFFRQVARSKIPLAQIVENIRHTAAVRPLVIQSLFMRIHGRAPPRAEQEAYCARLLEIARPRDRIKLVQIHTVARPPAEDFATALSDQEVDALEELVRRRTGLPVAKFSGWPT